MNRRTALLVLACTLMIVSITGCARATAWGARPSLKSQTLTVGLDGSGDYSTVQTAIDAVPANNVERVIIHIKPGIYREKIVVPLDRPCITFRGDDAMSTVLSWHLNASSKDSTGKQVGTSGSCSTLINATDFVAENITFENTAGDTGQAVALKFNSDRGVFRHCRFLGWQDTLYVHDRRCRFADCYIEGRVDFIFGKSTAVFERCTIHSKNGGFVTAPGTTPDKPFGLVFIDCKLTGDGEQAYLGRPWRPAAAAAFIHCELGPHIAPAGWNNWQKPDAERTSRFVEFENSGPGANPRARVAWSKQLTAAEALQYAPANILEDDDHWSPDNPLATSRPTTQSSGT